MILGRIHLIHLFDAVSQTFSTQILTLSIGRKYLFVHTFFKFCFRKTRALCQRLLVLVICNSNNQLPKSLIFCIPLVKKCFVVCMFFSAKFDGPKVFVVKLEWDHSESVHQRCYFFVLLILPPPRHVSTQPF